MKFWLKKQAQQGEKILQVAVLYQRKHLKVEAFLEVEFVKGNERGKNKTLSVKKNTNKRIRQSMDV